ncbi:UNVERIFIED_CONTAM: hypothetical protein Sradi_5442200 [Sesamum radiatum]|uniref:RRM domain-containing protein n=1 Tax=Sesamum radiatum TaxID=300843 RepID=A0AAW2LBB2_SESRA
MTIDDNSSIYVGGLPYDITEENLRRVFDIYGAVLAVKVFSPLIFTYFSSAYTHGCLFCGVHDFMPSNSKVLLEDLRYGDYALNFASGF